MRRLIAAAVVMLGSVPAQAGIEDQLRLRALDPIPVAAGDEAGPQAFTLADVNKDGTLDLAVIDREEELVAVRVGRGDGTFETGHVYELEGTPTAVAVTDLSSPFASEQVGDADGNPDLVVTYEDGFADVLLGRGDGEFDPPEQDLGEVLDSAELIGVVVGDFDGNDRNDLALLDFFEEVYFLCNLNGSLAPCNTDVLDTLGGGAMSMVGGDFDNDTFLDVAVLNLDSQDLAPIFGNGDGSFEPAEEPIGTSAQGEQSPRYLATGDLDADPSDDLVVGNYEQFNDLSVLALHGRPNRSFTAQPLPGLFELSALALTDFDADDRLDMVMVTGGVLGDLGVSLGDGGGGFGPLFRPIGAPSVPGRAMVAADLNDDDKPDLAILSADGSALQVSLNETVAPCTGDCNQNGLVSIDELILGVTIALSGGPATACPAFDPDASGGVAISELIAAVNGALAGC